VKPASVGEPLEPQLPLSEPILVAASSICRDEELAGFRVEGPPFAAPPTANRGYREGARVVIRPDVDPIEPAESLDATLAQPPWFVP
jgi:hypothetical protein